MHSESYEGNSDIILFDRGSFDVYQINLGQDIETAGKQITKNYAL